LCFDYIIFGDLKISLNGVTVKINAENSETDDCSRESRDLNSRNESESTKTSLASLKQYCSRNFKPTDSVAAEGDKKWRLRRSMSRFHSQADEEKDEQGDQDVDENGYEEENEQQECKDEYMDEDQGQPTRPHRSLLAQAFYYKPNRKSYPRKPKFAKKSIIKRKSSRRSSVGRQFSSSKKVTYEY